ncbi:unnamed protein product [Rotaria sp. Silwood2]|nr:unnamed protein product [Rotaria sp. Silwood2]
MATGGGEETIAQRILCITDIAQEPLEFIAPIGGFEEMPLVPLEIAVEPLVPLEIAVEPLVPILPAV